MRQVEICAPRGALFRTEFEESTFVGVGRTPWIRAAIERAVAAGADLTGALLRGADLSGARMRGANLTDADLVGADLTGADLTDARLTRANLADARLARACLRQAALAHACLTRARAQGADLEGADLDSADLEGADLTRATLKDVTMPDAWLYGANLTDACLGGADLTDADVQYGNLEGADLTCARLTVARLNGARLAMATLHQACLRGARLASADLTGATLARADLRDANFTAAILIGASVGDASRVPAQGATFADAIVPDAWLRPAPEPSISDSRSGERSVEISETLAQAHPGLLDLAISADDREPTFAGTVAQTDRLARLARGYRLRNPEVPVVAHLDARILRAVEEGGGALRMRSWHGEGPACGATHCRAGWAIEIAGEAGRALEARVGSRAAGEQIYRASTGRVPDFFGWDEDALADLRRWAQLDPIPPDDRSSNREEGSR